VRYLWGFVMGWAVAEAAGDAANELLPPGDNQRNKVSSHVKDLQQQIARMALLNQAPWELLRERLDLTDQDLEDMAAEIARRVASGGEQPQG